MVNLHINYDICMHDFCISCFRELRGESLTRDDSRKREVEVHDHDNCDGLLKLKCTSRLSCKHSGKGKRSRLGCKGKKHCHEWLNGVKLTRSWIAITAWISFLKGMSNYLLSNVKPLEGHVQLFVMLLFVTCYVTRSKTWINHC